MNKEEIRGYVGKGHFVNPTMPINHGSRGHRRKHGGGILLIGGVFPCKAEVYVSAHLVMTHSPHSMRGL